MSSYVGLQEIIAERSAPHNISHAALHEMMHDLLVGRRLCAVFQPIINLQEGAIVGYEGLIRGPADGPLHAPADLFRAADVVGVTGELESVCVKVILEQFAALNLPGKAFVNIGSESLSRLSVLQNRVHSYLKQLGLAPDRIVLEVTEGHRSFEDYADARASLDAYRSMGFEIALDDLGEGYSGLRRWSELRPEYIKIDKYFIDSIDTDAVKQQFLRSLQDIARKTGATVIAEGIEAKAELLWLRNAGIDCGQGYYVALPHASPLQELTLEVHGVLAEVKPPKPLKRPPLLQSIVTARSLLRTVPVATPLMNNSQVYDVFLAQPDLQTIPVVERGEPLGIITRASLIDRFARPYQRELYGKKSCTVFMNPHPLMTDKDTSLQKLSHLLVAADSAKLISDFIITDNGHYLGIGTSHDLLRELTELQISAAKHANPLTLLPGGVPTNQHIDYLLQSKVEFCACYADLDNFKPFNDVFGYRKGDDIIQVTGDVLFRFADSELDFVGHIGGDDFLVLFQSGDWRTRCEGILSAFEDEIADVCNGIVQDSGYYAEDRKGNRQFYNAPSLSLGVVPVHPHHYDSHHQIAAAAAEAKIQAKKTAGNSLFIDRRQGPLAAGIKPPL